VSLSLASFRNQVRLAFAVAPELELQHIHSLDRLVSGCKALHSVGNFYTPEWLQSDARLTSSGAEIQRISSPRCQKNRKSFWRCDLRCRRRGSTRRHRAHRCADFCTCTQNLPGVLLTPQRSSQTVCMTAGFMRTACPCCLALSDLGMCLCTCSMAQAAVTDAMSYAPGAYLPVVLARRGRATGTRGLGFILGNMLSCGGVFWMQRCAPHAQAGTDLHQFTPSCEQPNRGFDDPKTLRRQP